MRDIKDELEKLSQNNLRRSLRWIERSKSSLIKIDDRELINFSSNDYLGLSQHPAAIQCMATASQQWGVGSGASRLITGSQAPHQELETFIAEQKQCEAALSFSSGYATAIGTLTSLLGKGDVVILDKLSHASLIDGAKLSGATLRVFPHNDMGALKKLLGKLTLKRPPEQRILIVTESVFSMDGDLCPLNELVELKEQFNCLLLLDEAHGLGVLGQKGLGLAEKLSLQKRIDIHMGTLSKSVGVSGGYIASNKELIELLLNKARSFIYSTSPPAAIAATSLTNLQIIVSHEGQKLREKLHQNLSRITEDLNLPTTASAIIPIILNDSKAALALSHTLLEKGFLAPAIRYPTVPKNAARLRVTISATHSEEQIHLLVKTLRPLLRI